MHNSKIICWSEAIKPASMDFLLTLCAFSVERGNLVALRVDVNADAHHPTSNFGALNVGGHYSFSDTQKNISYFLH